MLKRLLPVLLLGFIVTILGCPPGENCDPGKIFDCAGNCIDESEADDSAGDGTCDEAFNCTEFNFDGGDCVGEDCEQGQILDCTGNCIDESEKDNAVGDGTCDANLNCPKFEDDGGDCGTTTPTTITTTTTTTAIVTDSTSWVRSYCNVKQFPYKIKPTSDGGYIAFSIVNNAYDGSGVLKMDSNGDVEWYRKYSQSEYVPGYIHDLQQTKDGGYVFVGSVPIENPSNNLIEPIDWTKSLLVKMDNEGNIEWKKTYEGQTSLTNIQQTKDGGYFTRGEYLMKLDAAGNIEWLKGYNVGGQFMQQTADGGYVLVDPASSKSGWYIKVLKLDQNGNPEWHRSYNTMFIGDFRQTADGGYIVSGYETPPQEVIGPFGDALVLKLDRNGNIEWQKKYGDEVGWIDEIQQTTDGGYITFAGFLNRNSPNLGDIILFKLDQNGNIEWQKMLQEQYPGIDDLQQTSDGGYLFLSGNHCQAGMGFHLVKLNSSGDIPGCDIFTAYNQTTFQSNIKTATFSLESYVPDVVVAKDISITLISENYDFEGELVCIGE